MNAAANALAPGISSAEDFAFHPKLTVTAPVINKVIPKSVAYDIYIKGTGLNSILIFSFQNTEDLKSVLSGKLAGVAQILGFNYHYLAGIYKFTVRPLNGADIEEIAQDIIGVMNLKYAGVMGFGGHFEVADIEPMGKLSTNLGGDWTVYIPYIAAGVIALILLRKL